MCILSILSFFFKYPGSDADAGIFFTAHDTTSATLLSTSSYSDVHLFLAVLYALLAGTVVPVTIDLQPVPTVDGFLTLIPADLL